MERRRAAQSSTGCVDQTLAEMLLPDAIDNHARNERVVAGDQPISQLQPAARAGGDIQIALAAQGTAARYGGQPVRLQTARRAAGAPRRAAVPSPTA